MFSLFVVILQLPLQVSVGKSEVRHELPLELVGWLLRKMSVPDNAWLLVMSSDPRSLLSCNLILRWAAAVNVVMGNTDLTSNKVTSLYSTLFVSLCAFLSLLSSAFFFGFLCYV